MMSENSDPRTTDEDALVKLAVARFPTLTPAEKNLFRKIAAGEVADYSSSNQDENDPAHAEDWGENRVLQAERIAWLCANKKAREYITHRGLHIRGARIEGVLDLEIVRFPYYCVLERCAITNEIILRYAELSGLSLSGSFTGPIRADGMKVDGGVFLNNGFKAEGEVRLAGATIGGDLDRRAD